MAKLRKKKVIKVQTKFGEKEFVFVPTSDELGEVTQSCSNSCSYFETCQLLRDPRNIDDEKSSFMDFCVEQGSEEGAEDGDIENMYPEKGSIEKAFGDVEVFSEILDKNPKVEVRDLIKGFCNGMCDQYSEDFKNCGSDNMMCILQNVFANKKYKSINKILEDRKKYLDEIEKKTEADETAEAESN